MSSSPNLYVRSSAREIGVNAPVIALIRGVTMTPTAETPLQTAIVAKTNDLPEWIERARARREAEGFKKLFTRLGHPDQIGAFARLSGSTLERGFKNINAIVDAYNIACLRTGSPIGCHDLDTIEGDLTIERAEAGVRITPLSQTRSRPVPEGDLIYSAGAEPLCWMGRKDVDADAYAVKEGTRSILIMAIGNEDADVGYNEEVCDEAFRWMKVAFPDATLEKKRGELLSN